ncbi:sugar transferase [Candidatus Sumerlaeota bacterium]|nr:sugar transferase [Candidatus Sumerlaeota bacterium]MBI3736467.1 sugar transferase [Candidatus Sumerlaeota bacterium]
MKSFWKSQFLTLILVVADVVAFCLIWREAWELRSLLTGARFDTPINPWENYAAILPKLLVVWLLMMTYFEHYAHRGKISSLNQIGNVIKAGIGLLIGTMAVSYLFKDYDVGRSVIIMAAAGMTIYIYLSRTALRRMKEIFVARGHGLTRAVIIGAGETGRKVAARIKNHPEVGYHLVGFIDRDAAKTGSEIEGVPVIGGTEKLVDLLLRHRVEEVFLAIPNLGQNDTFNLITDCEQARVNFNIVSSNLLQVITSRVKIDDIEDMPIIPLREGRLTPINALLKRLLDLAIAVPSLLVFSIPMGIIALVIKLDSPGAAIFAQDRIGKDGKRFRFFKFRTMRSNVEPYAKAPDDPSDPRVTKIGAILRKTSLDELPQLWNVVKGEMSMVGPRPEMPFIVDQYEPWQRRRLNVPQGLTGLWQIAGRKHLPLHLNLEYDFYYIRNWSLLLDLEILLKTIPTVLFGNGAF